MSSKLASDRHSVVRILDRRNLVSNSRKENTTFIFGSKIAVVLVGTSRVPMEGFAHKRPLDGLVENLVQASVQLRSTIEGYV